MDRLKAKLRGIRALTEKEVGNGTGFWVGKTRVIKIMNSIDTHVILPTLKRFPKIMKAFETEPTGPKGVIYVDLKFRKEIIEFVKSEIDRLSNGEVETPQTPVKKRSKEEEKARKIRRIIAQKEKEAYESE